MDASKVPHINTLKIMITLAKLRCLTSVTDSPNQPSMQVGKWAMPPDILTQPLYPTYCQILSTFCPYFSLNPSILTLSSTTGWKLWLSLSCQQVTQSTALSKAFWFLQPILNFAIKVLFPSQIIILKYKSDYFTTKSFKSIFISESGTKRRQPTFQSQRRHFSEHQGEGPQLTTNRSR